MNTNKDNDLRINMTFPLIGFARYAAQPKRSEMRERLIKSEQSEFKKIQIMYMDIKIDEQKDSVIEYCDVTASQNVKEVPKEVSKEMVKPCEAENISVSFADDMVVYDMPLETVVTEEDIAIVKAQSQYLWGTMKASFEALGQGVLLRAGIERLKTKVIVRSYTGVELVCETFEVVQTV